MNEILLTEADLDMMINQNKESREQYKLPSFLVSAFETQRTSLGKNPALPSDAEVSFIEKIVKERLDQLYQRLDWAINDSAQHKIEKESIELLSKISKQESTIAEPLTKLCQHTVVKLFGLPDTIKFELTLGGETDLDQTKIIDDDFEWEDTEEMDSTENEVYKRRMIDCMVQGAAIYYASKWKNWIGEVFEINPDLPDEYRKFMSMADYLSFVTDERKPGAQKPFGMEMIKMGDEPTIIAQGTILPILMIETIKGVMELFASHGLPKSMKLAQYVTTQADIAIAEPWDMRLGPGIWKRILRGTDNEDNTEIVPYMFANLVSQPVDEFNSLVKGLLCNARKSKEKMKEIIISAQDDMDFSKFSNRLNDKRKKVKLLRDQCFTPEELEKCDN